MVTVDLGDGEPVAQHDTTQKLFLFRTDTHTYLYLQSDMRRLISFRRQQILNHLFGHIGSLFTMWMCNANGSNVGIIRIALLRNLNIGARLILN
jgi:hypothetical protein